jgi:hypothetical protein
LNALCWAVIYHAMSSVCVPAVVEEKEPLTGSPQRGSPELLRARGQTSLRNPIGICGSHVVERKVREGREGVILRHRRNDGRN